VGAPADSGFPFGPRELFSVISQAANRADVGILVTSWDPDPKILYANEAISSLTELPGTEIREGSLWSLLTRAEGARVKQLHDERLQGESLPTSLTTRLRHVNGGEIPVEMSSTKVSSGATTVVVSFIMDVSERQRAWDELRSSETRFARLLDSAPEGVLMLQQNRVLSANLAAATFFGAARPLDLLGHDLSQFVTVQSQASLSGLGEHSSNPVVVTAVAGADLELSAVALDYEGQRLVLAFVRDISERNLMQQRLMQAERLAAVGMLAAGVAHEINNPLAYVLLNLKYLERELPLVANDPTRIPKLLQHLADASHGASRVHTIVKDLRSFARTDNETSGAIDLNPIIESAISMAEVSLAGKGKLQTKLLSQSRVVGVAAKLEQVVLNLLMNAIQALDAARSGNVIAIETVESGETHIRLTITDTGVGLEAQNQERAFDPFFTTKPRGMGTGLGLPICRRIVESFGGRIWLTPMASGTRATVELQSAKSMHANDAADSRVPSSLQNNPPGSAAVSTPRTDGSVTRARVLIIDDESSVATMLARFLEPLYEVKHTTLASEALELLAASGFDAILCDVMMPGMSGIELYEELKSQSARMDRRIIFMTGGGLHPEVNAFLRAADRPKLEKPFDVRELKRVLHDLVKTQAGG
jgi:PAS domain S-box-containing protein